MLKDQIKHVAMVYKIALSVCIGFALAMAAFPAPKTSDNCGVYKVNSRPVTAFVLKPPPAEPATCPVAPKCEPQVTNSEDSVSKTEASNVDERQSRRHHRRRYRVKAYWK